tara:strand:- start:337 stop:720 length:384 start_codon:yes stop_codon:yes gene_type:complete
MAGTFLSATCALHCGLVAVAPALLVMSGLGSLLDERAEWAFTATAAMVGGAAAVMAWRAGRRVVVGAFVLAGSALILGRALEPLGELAELSSIAGGLGLAVAHVLNLRAAARGAAREPDPCPPTATP